MQPQRFMWGTAGLGCPVELRSTVLPIQSSLIRSQTTLFRLRIAEGIPVITTGEGARNSRSAPLELRRVKIIRIFFAVQGRRILPTSSEVRLAFNGHSMVGTLQRVLVCSPRTAGWNQPERVSAWRELGFHHAPEFETAQSQHGALVKELQNAGAEVADLPAGDKLSLDAVYTHDASLATDFGLILMRPEKRTGWRRPSIMVRRALRKESRLLVRSLLWAQPKLATFCGSTRRRCHWTWIPDERCWDCADACATGAEGSRGSVSAAAIWARAVGVSAFDVADQFAR